MNISTWRSISGLSLFSILEATAWDNVHAAQCSRHMQTLDSRHNRGLEFCWQEPNESGVMLQCRGLEKALDQYAQPTSAAPASEADPAADGDQKVREARRSSARESRKKALRNLSVPERDVLLVLGAICKVCCRICCLPAVGTTHTTHLAVHQPVQSAHASGACSDWRPSCCCLENRSGWRLSCCYFENRSAEWTSTKSSTVAVSLDVVNQINCLYHHHALLSRAPPSDHFL